MTRRGRLIERVAELEQLLYASGDVPYPAISYQLRGGGPADHPSDDITLQRRVQRDGTVRWAVYRFGTTYALTRDGTWAFEPQPSSRSDDYLAWTRYTTPADALDHFRRCGNKPYIMSDK